MEKENICVEDSHENVYTFESIRRLKYYLALIAFGFPIIIFGLNVLVRPLNPISIEVIWCLVVLITVFLLMAVELFGEKTIKNYKYYHCVTLFIYEFILILSIITYIYSLMNIRFVGKCIDLEALQNLPFEFRRISKVLYFILVGIIYSTHWTRVTNVHISLCRWKIFGIEPKQLDWHDTPVKWIPLFFTSTLFVLGSLLILLSMVSGDYDTPYYNYVYLAPVLYTLNMTVSQVYVTKLDYVRESLAPHPWRVEKCFATSIAFTFILNKFSLLKYENIEFKYTDSILCLICCLSISREWFLDLELFPKKYDHYFKNKLNSTLYPNDNHNLFDVDNRIGRHIEVTKEDMITLLKYFDPPNQPIPDTLSHIPAGSSFLVYKDEATGFTMKTIVVKGAKSLRAYGDPNDVDRLLEDDETELEVNEIQKKTDGDKTVESVTDENNALKDITDESNNTPQADITEILIN